MRPRRLLALLLLVGVLLAPLMAPPACIAHATGPFTITTLVTAGEGTIETIEPLNPIPLGTTKHYRIRPARGWMIGDVRIDGRSIGPSMFASLPFVQADHTVEASFVPFDPLQATQVATPVKPDLRILMLGAQSSTGFYLEQMIAQDPSIPFTVSIETYSDETGSGLLAAYFFAQGSTTNFILGKFFEGWDYVIPFDAVANQRDYPELHLEALRLFYNWGWFSGGEARMIVPVAWDYQRPPERVNEQMANTYRIASGLRVPVLPCGKGWEYLVNEVAIVPNTNDALRTSGYTCAAMLYAQLFGRAPSLDTYTPPIENGLFPTDQDRALATQLLQIAQRSRSEAQTTPQFSGAHNGNATPFLSNGGRGFHFGTSTRERSIDKIVNNIAQFDPEVGSLSFSTSSGFTEIGQPGSAAQAELANNQFTYMWRQNREDANLVFENLNTVVRQQYGQDPYFIWFSRYADTTDQGNADLIGIRARTESALTFQDNHENPLNPNRRSRTPQSHVGWGRIWAERSDVQMMEPDLLHASGPIMSMFAAQAYALITGRDASRYGSWDYAGDPAQAALARYAQRVGYKTIMQGGTLDVNEPYDVSPYDVLEFNELSPFYQPPARALARDDEYVVSALDDLTVSAAQGVLTNDLNLSGGPITAELFYPPDPASPDDRTSLPLAPDGSFSYTPPFGFTGIERFTYWVKVGDQRVSYGRVTLRVLPATQVASAAPDQPTTMEFIGRNGTPISITVPAGALSEPTQLIFYNRMPGSAGGVRNAGWRFDLTAVRNNALVPRFTFLQPATITMTYRDADVVGLDVADLQLFYYDVERRSWQTDGIRLLEHDRENKQITFAIDHLTQFALGTTNRIYLPALRR